MTHIDLFDPPAQWRVTQPPGASHHVLMWGDRVMAQGDISTLQLNEGYRHAAR